MKPNAWRYKDIQDILLVSYIITWYLIIYNPSDSLIFIFYDPSDYFIVCSTFYFKSFAVKNRTAGSVHSEGQKALTVAGMAKNKVLFFYFYVKAADAHPGSSQGFEAAAADLPAFIKVPAVCGRYLIIDEGFLWLQVIHGPRHWSGFSWPVCHTTQRWLI